MCNQIKTRFASWLLIIITAVTLFPGISTMAAESQGIEPLGETPYTSGWDQMLVTTSVIDANGAKIGTVYAGEGVTVLSCRSDMANIEYSSGSSFKRGFVSISSLRYGGRYPDTDVGVITNSCNTYYAPYGNHYAGSVNTDETVAVLSKSDDWYYIEYNVSGGQRKRAYISANNIYCYYGAARSSHYHEYPTVGSPISVFVSSTVRVYAGPNSSSYPDIGSISSSDNGQVYGYADFYDANGNRMLYIGYPTSNGTKYGYIYY